MDNTKIYNQLSAMKTAVDLANANIQSTSEWVSPEKVIEFIEKVFTALDGETKTAR